MTRRAVLTFHSIDDAPGPLSFPAHALASLLAALQAARVPFVTLDALLGNPASDGVALTFDDGMQSVRSAALPLLRRFRAPAHVFLSPAVIDGDVSTLHGGGAPMLSWADVTELARHDVAIESHGYSHRDLRTLNDAEIASECHDTDARIQRCTGRQPTYFAYPFGRADARVRACIRTRYRAAFTTRLAYLTETLDPAALPRLDAHYLRAGVVQRHVATRAVKGYLTLRGWMRTLRGSQ